MLFLLILHNIDAVSQVLHFLLEAIDLGCQLFILFLGDGEQLIGLSVDAHVPVSLFNHIGQLLLVEKHFLVVDDGHTLFQLHLVSLHLLEFLLYFEPFLFGFGELCLQLSEYFLPGLELFL